MKVKDSVDILKRKKNALPSSKLLKPKNFKSCVKKSGVGNKLPASKGKHGLLGNKNINNLLQLADHQILKGKKKSIETKSPRKSSFSEEKPVLLTSKKSKKLGKEFNLKNVSTLFDFVTSEAKSKKDKESHEDSKIGSVMSRKQNNKEKLVNKFVGDTDSFDKDLSKGIETSIVDKCTLKANKIAVITKKLLKLVDETSSNKTEILDNGEPVFLQVECIKIPICPTKQLKFILPCPLTEETSDVLLVTADLKGHKIYPDRAVDYYEELLAKHQINFITKVMPLRMLKKEYSQYEMRRKLVDQFDVILADSRIHKSLPAVLGKFVLYKRKMPIPVNLRIGEPRLKKHLQDAICKTQMTIKSNGHSSIVQVGHSKMSPKDIAANVVEVAQSLENLYPGGWKNIRSLVIKTAKSISLPVYLSLLSPNEVRIPVEVHKKPEPVEDELSTMPGYNVAVTADGNVVLKKVEEDIKIDNTRDDEILEEAKKYLESLKTVRYDESSDEDQNEAKGGSNSEDEGEAVTEALEKKLMNKYEKNAKAVKKTEEEEEESEEEESEEESEVPVVIGKKRKSQGTKKPSGPPPKKVLNPVGNTKKQNKLDKSKKAINTASPSFKKQQTRGSRGGKKSKMSKDQRKALIKRKKAGKK